MPFSSGSFSASLWIAALAMASPWLAFPLLVWWRARGSRALDDSPAPSFGDDAPLVSVIVPARDEAPNVARCVRSVLAADYPRLELIVVDDHSTDGTAGLARDASSGDARLRVLENPPLPTGWFGKQWACATGAASARGDVLLFADADTTQARDLISRAVHTLHARGGGLLSIVGRQEMGTFWERLVQPQVLALIMARYGGTERVNRSPRTVDKIANGQCLLMDRATYDAIGGHAAVRQVVAEDLMLAQTVFAAGRPVHLVLGERQLATRMYTSLADLMRGWRKNVYAGGREAMPLGRAGRAVFPLFLALPPLMGVVPTLLLVAGALGLLPPVLVAAALIASVASLLFWAATYRRAGVTPLYALVAPVGSAIFLTIVVQAVARGRRVEWRGREYVSA